MRERARRAAFRIIEVIERTPGIIDVVRDGK